MASSSSILREDDLGAGTTLGVSYKVVVGTVSLFSGAPEKGLETQQVEFPKTALGSGIFSQPSECGFKWETQAVEGRACLDAPPLSHSRTHHGACFQQGKHVIIFISQAWEA